MCMQQVRKKELVEDRFYEELEQVFYHFPKFVCLFLAQQPPVDQNLLMFEVSRPHTTTHHSR